MCSMWQSEYLLVDVLRVLWCFCKAMPKNTIITSYFAWPPTPVSTLASSCVIFPQTSGWHLLMASYLYVPLELPCTFTILNSIKPLIQTLAILLKGQGFPMNTNRRGRHFQHILQLNVNLDVHRCQDWSTLPPGGPWRTGRGSTHSSTNTGADLWRPAAAHWDTPL